MVCQEGFCWIFRQVISEWYWLLYCRPVKISPELTALLIIPDGINIRILPHFAYKVSDYLYYHMCGLGLVVWFIHRKSLCSELTNDIKYYCIRQTFYRRKTVVYFHLANAGDWTVWIRFVEKQNYFGNKTHSWQDYNLPGKIAGWGFFAKSPGWQWGVFASRPGICHSW